MAFKGKIKCGASEISFGFFLFNYQDVNSLL